MGLVCFIDVQLFFFLQVLVLFVKKLLTCEQVLFIAIIMNQNNETTGWLVQKDSILLHIACR